jgi:hypothetical protein
MKPILTILQFVVKQNTKKGSYTLEAAIFLPLFIVGIMTLGFTIRMISAAENISFAATDEARLAAGYAYNIPIAPLFSNKLQTRLVDENRDISSVEVQEFRYLYPSGNYDGLISFRVNYWIGTGLPLGMIEGMEVSQHYRCRGFIGRTEQGSPLGFDEMERNLSAYIVWVFPDGGKKYHTKSCTFVASYPIQIVLNEEIRNRYEPCPKCGSGDSKNGSLVCCFPTYGEAYHLQSCPTVDKYIISMEQNQAEARGYTPCLKCGGVE